MPGPKNKRQTNANARRSTVAKELGRLDEENSFPSQCLTLDEHGIARCVRFATDGDVRQNRCRAHYEQYRTLCKRYTDASVIVDGIRGSAELPTKGQVDQYTDWHAALEKARWVRNYLDVIWVERTGREIHRKRFFLQVDDAHNRRLKLLRGEMVRAVDVLDALQGKAHQLYLNNGNLHVMNARRLSTAEAGLERQSRRTAKDILECIRNPIDFCKWPRLMPLFIVVPPSVGDEDLIDVSLRDTRQRMLKPLEPFVDFESFKDTFTDILGPRPTTESGMAMFEKMFFVHQQFARRIIFHEPALFVKSLEKTSVGDLLLSDEFSMEDLARFLSLFMNPLAFPLRRFKDAVLDILAVSNHDTAADLEGRFQLLGGQVFIRSHDVSMSDEAWWLLLKALQTSANVENCFIRLCNNFDDLVTLLSFTAFGLVPGPSFCRRPSQPGLDDPSLSRNHLSLSGIVVADMVGASLPPKLCGPIPTILRAKKPNCIVWTEIEPRAYMFGAMRNEQDPFVDAFLQELRARPDLFQVVLHSETAPGRRVEMFGSGPSNDQALPAVRSREFEAPPSYPPSVPPSMGDKWNVEWSATDVLFRSGQEPEMKGYLAPKRGLDGYFRFKTFPVKYFAILDTVPYRDSTALARNVAWAALRAGGYAEGEYTVNKYAAAADELLERCARERLGWLPKEMEWKLPRVQDRMSWCTIM